MSLNESGATDEVVRDFPRRCVSLFVMYSQDQPVFSEGDGKLYFELRPKRYNRVESNLILRSEVCF